MEDAIEDIEGIWQQFRECADKIRMKTSEAELLLIMIANELSSQSALPSSGTHGDVPEMHLETRIEDLEVSRKAKSKAKEVQMDWVSPFNSLPSSEPSGEEAWAAWEPTAFKLDPAIRTVREIWQAWKIGSAETPSVEYMNKRFGDLAFATTKDERLEAVTHQKIIEEIELHLENGRELEEVLVVATLTLEACNNNLREFARKILENTEMHRATLFELGSSGL